MGNLQKITKTSATSGILDEIERTPEQKRKFDPEKHAINPELTHLNYSLIDHGVSSTEYLKQRLSEVKVQNRADVKVLGQWVWTMPKDLEPQYQEQFFEEIVKYHVEKFGAENICYARVHLDEATPHLHLGIIPIVKINGHRTDGKTEKCCAKDVFNRAYFQSAHADLQKYLEAKLGTEVNIINGQTLGVDGIQNYKAAKDLAKQIPILEARVDELKAEIEEKEEKVKELDAEISEKAGILNNIKNLLADAKKKLEATLEFIKGHPNMFEMFLNWLHPDKSSKENQATVKAYTEELKRENERARDTDLGL